MNDSPADTIDQLAEYLRLNPDATAVGTVGAIGADPDRWVDVVENALATADPPATLRNAETAGTEPDPIRSNPGGNADASPSATPDPDGRTDTADAPDVDPGLNQQSPPDDGPVLVKNTDAPVGWSDADFSATRSDTYPPELLERTRWMGRAGDDGKLPFSPWGDADPVDADPDDSPRWEWKRAENYADGDTVAIAEDDPRLAGRVFIQLEDDPFAFVDGDDVRDPDTGEIHPAFRAILAHLGVTYADVSTSGAGVHAYYHAPDGLPIDGKGQATFPIDTEPWGANDDAPTVEIYANTHVNVTTGEHVDGTPLDLAEWDTGALRAILEANGYTDKPTVSHDTDRDRPELEGYDPDAVDADDTAEDVRDVLKAVDRLRASDLPLRSRRTGEDSTGWSTWDPSYRSSESGESVHSPPDEPVFHDHKEGESYGVLGLFAAEEGIIREPWDRLEGSDWWDTVDAARDAGAPIPSFDTVDDTEPAAVLPPSVRDLATAASGWDWKHAGRDTELTIDAVRERTVDAIADAYGRGDRTLIESLPTGGKTYGSVLAAARTGEPVTILTGRGRKEQYAQLREWCDEHGLTHYTLPSFTRDCETANGEHGEEWADRVRGWYNRGATPKAIHAFAEDVLGRPLPCQEHEGHRCPYAEKWDVDPDTDGSADPGEDAPIDVLIGHYAHAHKPKVTTGRTVVFDEFPGGSYETTLAEAGDLQRSVSHFLEGVDAIPFDTYTDLVENRSDESRRADALLWFDEHGVEPDERAVFDDRSAHADAPIAAFTLLAAEDLGNGYERADLGDAGRAVFDRATGAVSVLRPPALEYVTGVVALDGTPTKRMWELTLGERLTHRPILADAERAEYVRDALNLNLVRTTEYVKPYNSAEHVNTAEDAALLEGIADAHGERPAVITSSTAEHEYDAEDVLQYVDDTRHYGNVLGSNEYDDTRLGAVIGSNHYGDGYIKKWGAYAGDAVERGDGKGADLSYTGIGDDVLQHMREHETLQAAMRFGRDGNGAVVYVHTDTLPDWVPIAAEGRVTRTRSDGERAVLEAAAELGEWRTADLAEHPAVSVGERQVFNILNRLAERDDAPIDREYDGRGYTYRDDGLHEVNDHGEVTIDPVDLEDVDDDETVREIARSSIYTWDFLNRTADPDADPARTSTDAVDDAIDPAPGGDPPPEPGD
ncbi:hypothetical protein [Halorubrum amylolyticum]|uniref:hypothetical protein n=1 Tax=Halorubrum amylolyticum TaxID=2508724 RepID=UPI001008AC90|nr:hypothetical protein [Halorubrum amylolyticum]